MRSHEEKGVEEDVTARRSLPWQSPPKEMLIRSEELSQEPFGVHGFNSGGDCHAANGFKSASGYGGGPLAMTVLLGTSRTEPPFSSSLCALCVSAVTRSD